MPSNYFSVEGCKFHYISQLFQLLFIITRRIPVIHRGGGGDMGGIAPFLK